MFTMDILQVLVIALGYIIAFLTSGLIVRLFIGNSKQISSDLNSEPSDSSNKDDLGAVIGKCENFLVITFILVNATTGLALILTAKSILRMDDIKKDSRYYLGGTLINFSYSVFIGFLIHVILAIIQHPLQLAQFCGD